MFDKPCTNWMLVRMFDKPCTNWMLVSLGYFVPLIILKTKCPVRVIFVCF